jgi:hypothetical protein
MRQSLPGVCIVCRERVHWWDGAWRQYRPGRRFRRHECNPERPRCNALMPYAEGRCARRPGHRHEHRSAYALENARRMNSGIGLAEYVA